MIALILSVSWMQDAQSVLNFISSFGVVVPLIIGLYGWAKLSPAARTLVVYFGFWFVEAFVDLWSRKALHTNMWLFHVTVLVETWLLGWAYYRVLDVKLVRRLLPWAGVVFTLVALADAFWINDLHHENTVARVVQVSLMLTLIMTYFEQWLREMRADSPWYDFMFMVSVGLAIYYTGSVMSYLSITPHGVGKVVMMAIIDSSYNVGLVIMTIAMWREVFARNSPRHRLGSSVLRKALNA